MLNTGIKDVREQVKDDVDNGQAGTGETLPKITDTALESAIAETNLTLSNKTISGDTVVAVHIVTTALGNGNTLTEWEISDVDNTISYNRTIKAPYIKTSTDTREVIHSFKIEAI